MKNLLGERDIEKLSPVHILSTIPDPVSRSPGADQNLKEKEKGLPGRPLRFEWTALAPFPVGNFSLMWQSGGKALLINH